MCRKISVFWMVFSLLWMHHLDVQAYKFPNYDWHQCRIHCEKYGVRYGQWHRDDLYGVGYDRKPTKKPLAILKKQEDRWIQKGELKGKQQAKTDQATKQTPRTSLPHENGQFSIEAYEKAYQAEMASFSRKKDENIAPTKPSASTSVTFVPKHEELAVDVPVASKNPIWTKAKLQQKGENDGKAAYRFFVPYVAPKQASLSLEEFDWYRTAYQKGWKQAERYYLNEHWWAAFFYTKIAGIPVFFVAGVVSMGVLLGVSWRRRKRQQAHERAYFYR